MVQSGAVAGSVKALVLAMRSAGLLGQTPTVRETLRGTLEAGALSFLLTGILALIWKPVIH